MTSPSANPVTKAEPGRSATDRASSDGTAVQPAVTARLSIGALSRATDIPVETLRTWERRYGFPVGLRDEAGQRHYHLATPVHLLLIKQALQLGMRAAQVVPLPLHELRLLLNQASGQPAPAPSPAPAQPDAAPLPQVPPAPAVPMSELNRWIDATRRYDGEALGNMLRRAWNQVGSVAFLDDLARPLMVEIGRRWAMAELNVAHEHFVTEHLRALLADMTVAERHAAPCVVCANLPGELHSLGLEMAAVVLRQSGLRVLYLGADMPLGDMAQAVRYAANHLNLVGVTVSLSAAIELRNARDQLAQLRSLVPAAVPVLAGGAGMPGEVAGVTTLGSLRELQAWAEQCA